MSKVSRAPPWPMGIDLATVRETLAYMQGDVRRVPGLEKVAAALAMAIREIDSAERSGLEPLAARWTGQVLPPRRH